MKEFRVPQGMKSLETVLFINKCQHLNNQDIFKLQELKSILNIEINNIYCLDDLLHLCLRSEWEDNSVPPEEPLYGQAQEKHFA